jgi:hypothetical protein
VSAQGRFFPSSSSSQSILTTRTRLSARNRELRTGDHRRGHERFDTHLGLDHRVASSHYSRLTVSTQSGINRLLNDQLLHAGKSPLGFLNPWLYSAAASAMNDITTGQSNYGCGQNGFSAAVGWDPVSSAQSFTRCELTNLPDYWTRFAEFCKVTQGSGSLMSRVRPACSYWR